jgi:integrase
MVEEEALKRIRKVKQLAENNKRLRFLSKEECEALINVCDNHLKPVVIMAIHTGMRRGEILSLTWDQIDVASGFIYLEVTKNGERREIPIDKKLKETLGNIIRRLDIPYVFYDAKTGKPFKEVKKSYASAVKKAKLKDLHFHDLRHTYASLLVMDGVSIPTLMKLLGHKSMTMTMRYANLSQAHKAKAVEALDRIFGDSFDKKMNITSLPGLV